MDVELEVYRALREAQTRLTYLLLATAGASIGFAVTQTQQATLGWRHVPLGGAVLCWAVSFYCGCRHLRHTTSALELNVGLIRVIDGRDREVGSDPQRIAATLGPIRTTIEAVNRRVVRSGKLQFVLLVAGAVLFVGWHTLEMYLRR